MSTDRSDRFSGEERTLLSRYVTRVEGDVFVLTNLPEVIKGALFSRYSRSRLGLRELLLREFIQNPEAEFGAIAAGHHDVERSAEAGGAPESHLAVERAQNFYDRILDGYGDDSIGELGGAHLALENVSMLATKVLEDARIGGSPLEKSTRYVSFGEQRDGEYLFYKEPRLMTSAHGGCYVDTMRALFGCYVELLPVLREYIERVAPREPGVSDGVWRRSVNARVYDALRGLLPAAALTNMGIYGNGRFFETLMGRLQLSELGEMQSLAGSMRTELGKVIPSFIRRTRPEHPHFESLRAFSKGLESVERALASDVPHADPAPRESTVELVDYDESAEQRVLAALVYPRIEGTLEEARQWAGSLSSAKRGEVFQQLAGLRENRRHKLPRALELVTYTFDLLGDFGMYRDLHRHRTLTQQRQPLSPRHGFALPPDVVEAGAAGQFAAMMEQAAETHEAIRTDLPAEAQYAVPMACNIRWMVHINLRALMWLVELRTTPQGHPAYRRMAQEMFRRVQDVHPALAGLMRFVDLEDYELGRLGAEKRQEDKAGR